MNNLRFTERNKIDDKKWNEAIIASLNTLPYALTWYLDAVAENWGAFILNDYEAVMPAIWMRKWAVKCVYQPYYCQQLGIFSKQAPTTELYHSFLKSATSAFPYIDMNLNPLAAPVGNEAGVGSKKNLLLDLNTGYLNIQKQYTENHKRNISKAAKAAVFFSEETTVKDFQHFYLGNINHNKENFKPKHAQIFKALSSYIIQHKHGYIFTAANNEGLLAGVLVIEHQKRLIAIINTSSVAGKKTGASHFLFNQIIQKFAGSNYMLDFEGSSIATIARFYEGFGATRETFYSYRHNLLKSISRRF